jgi:hypothetical protein
MSKESAAVKRVFLGQRGKDCGERTRKINRKSVSATENNGSCSETTL